LKSLDATAGYWLCRILGYLQPRRKSNKHSGKDSLPGTPRRILVIRPGGMGDMILLLPALKQLQEKFPEAELDIICEKRNIGVLHLAGFGRNAMAYDAGIFGLLRRLRRLSYDMAIDTEQFHHFSAVIALLSRAPVRIGFKINPNRNPLYTHLVNYAVDGYEGRQFAKLLEPAGITNPVFKLEGIIQPSALKLPEPAQKKLDALGKKGKVVAIHPGSTTIFKQWDIANFTALVRTLISEHACTVALIGSHADISRANHILKRTKDLQESIASFTGSLSLEETAAMIRLSGLFVGGDSGLAHLAVAQGTPTVAIFGPTDPEKWGLIDARHKIARKAVSCSPCFIFGYHKPCNSIDCMAEIKVEDVLLHCADLLHKAEELTGK